MARVDYPALATLVHDAVHFLDNVIDANNFPLPRITERTLQTRKIGLGVMGFADLLLKMGIRYNSEEAVAVAEKVMAFIQEESRPASAGWPTSGATSPAYPGSRYAATATATARPHAQRHRHHHRPHRHHQHHRRGGSTASSRCSPFPSSAGCWRAPNSWRSTPFSRSSPERRGFYSPELMQVRRPDRLHPGFQGNPQGLRRLFVTAHEVSPLWHISIQSAFQKHTDNAVSKTVNFPQQATPDDVRRVYLSAYAEGLKGVTIYRDGSREDQVLSFGEKHKPKEFEYIVPRPRPEETTGVTR